MSFVIDQPTLSRTAMVARWLSIDLPYPEHGLRVEMDQFGEVFLSPLPTNRHQRLAYRIGRQIEEQLGGEAITSLAVLTRIGVRVPDVCWTRHAERYLGDPAPTAPEICVEVASPSNTEKWLLEKAAAYLAAGASEAIIVELDGRVRFFGPDGERSASGYGLLLVSTP